VLTHSNEIGRVHFGKPLLWTVHEEIFGGIASASVSSLAWLSPEGLDWKAEGPQSRTWGDGRMS
jgi:hypothetical protein